MKEKDIVKLQKDWEEEKKILEVEQKIKEEKKKYKRKFPTSKLLIFLLFINCTVIELFTGYILIKTIQMSQYTMISPAMTPLTTPIGSIVTQVIGYAVYSLKAMKENTKNGITYLNAEYSLNNNNFENEEG